MAALDWPDDLGHGTLVGRFGWMDADGSDIDTLPDLSPATGTVEITPRVTMLRYSGVAGPMILAARRIVAPLDSEGYMRTPGEGGSLGPRGIVVPATDDEDLDPYDWTYQVTVKLTGGVNLPPFNIAVPTGSTVDVSAVAPIPASSGTTTVVDTATADRAELAASNAEAFVADVQDFVERSVPSGGMPIFGTLAAAQAWEAANPGRVALTIEAPAPDPDPTGVFITDTFATSGQFFTASPHTPLRVTETGETWVYGDQSVFTSQGHGAYGEVNTDGKAVATLGNYLSPIVAVPTDRVRVSVGYSIPAATHFRLAIAGYIVHVDPGGSRFRLMTSTAGGEASVIQTQGTAPTLTGTVSASYDGYTISVENNGTHIVSWSVTPRSSTAVGFSVPTGGWADNFEVSYVA